MIEIHYSKKKLIRYNLILIFCILFFTFFGGLFFVKTQYFFSILFLIISTFIIYTEYFLIKCFKDKWIVRFDEEYLYTNKSLCGLQIHRTEINSINGYYQQGSYFQIGIKAIGIEKQFETKSFFDRFNFKMNKLFAKYQILIPGYLIEENPEETLDKIMIKMKLIQKV